MKAPTLRSRARHHGVEVEQVWLANHSDALLLVVRVWEPTHSLNDDVELLRLDGAGETFPFPSRLVKLWRRVA